MPPSTPMCGLDRRTSQSATDNSWWSYPAMAGTVGYTANSLNQYSTQVGTVTPTYDGNGNLTYDGTFTYLYDAESRLISVKQGSTAVASYAYDAQGRRKSKTVGARRPIMSPTPTTARSSNMTAPAARSSAGTPSAKARTRCWGR